MRTEKKTVARTRNREGSAKLSIIVPAYNEEEVIEEFHHRTASVLNGIDVSSEFVYVNDGSRDNTITVLEELRRSDQRIAIVNLSRNFGKEIALAAGLDYASGDAIVILDADLQDPPELIPELLDRWREGYDMVYAQRTSRAGESWLKKATAHLFYRMIRRAVKTDIPRDTGDFRLISRRAVDALNKLREHHRFMKGLYAWVGFRRIAVPYKREERVAGTTKWNYLQLTNLAVEGFTSFTVVPLRVASFAGVLTALFAFCYGAFKIYRTIVYGDPVAGFPTLIVAISFLSGVQLLALGIIGEYLGRIFNETKNRPLYFVQDYYPASDAE